MYGKELIRPSTRKDQKHTLNNGESYPRKKRGRLNSSGWKTWGLPNLQKLFFKRDKFDQGIFK